MTTPSKPSYDARWKPLHNILMGAPYASDYNSNQTAYWNSSNNSWEIRGGINCITSVNFFLGYMLNKGESGYDPAIIDNLVMSSARSSGFSDHFAQMELAFKPDGAHILKKLATSGSRYQGADRFPYWEMPFGTTKSVTCECGLHVSPDYIIKNKDKLANVNVASVSLASGEPVGSLTRFKRSFDDENTRPFNNTKLYWEYTVMLLFKINDQLFVYHHSSNATERWRTFQQQAAVYARGSGKRIQDSLWLVWKLPDKVWQTVNPGFFNDDDGSEWSPNK